MIHSTRPPYRRMPVDLSHCFSRYGAIASCAPLALALAVATPGAAHADPVTQRCAADALTPALARQRLEWARDCGVRMNVRSPSSPQPPSFSYDTGMLATDGVTHLIEYIESDDFWGTNSYSGINASINATSEMSASSRSRGRVLENPRAVSYETDNRYAPSPSSAYVPIDPRGPAEVLSGRGLY